MNCGTTEKELGTALAKMTQKLCCEDLPKSSTESIVSYVANRLIPLLKAPSGRVAEIEIEISFKILNCLASLLNLHLRSVTLGTIFGRILNRSAFFATYGAEGLYF